MSDKEEKEGKGNREWRIERAQGNATEVDTITQIAKALSLPTVARKKRKSLVGCIIEREIKSKGRKEDENQHNKRENAEKKISTNM